MKNKRSSSTAAIPRATKVQRLSVSNDSVAASSVADSANSCTRLCGILHTHTTARQCAHSSSQPSDNPLDLLVSAAKVVTDSATSSDRSSTPDASHSGADKTTSDVVNVPGLDNNLVAQPSKPRVQSTPSPVLAAEPITPAPTQSYASPTLIVSNEDYQYWIKWNDDGNQLYIGNWDFFVDTLVDLGFSAAGQTSVMKNFHGYGFKLESDGRCRVPDENGIVWAILYHDKFLRDQPELLKDIKRVAPPRKQ
ncbi:hypothetical protein GGH94_005916 [Coemansia aciculifera]|uniref:HSF-type DNA-binding domain-containing protein n=1 Tax=Coemansia aciculifera TaxID=417176 RepID=A0A9W8IJ45_9FUNG|nr:hypothetical protein GGH94_005916 [Coemansia aciculifera]KAJ2877037.1 hypothetical protein GGH93_000301 [Coemansia aciculifera]